VSNRFKFKVGDRVIISEPLHSYPTYRVWADMYKLKYFETGRSVPEGGAKGTVVAKGRHKDSPESKLYGVRLAVAGGSEGFRDVIMNEDGLTTFEGSIPDWIPPEPLDPALVQLVAACEIAHAGTPRAADIVARAKELYDALKEVQS